MNSTVAVIPAKAESTRLPGKNLLPFAGKPLVAHTIEQALASSEVDKVYVSTDSDEIASIARALGAEVPFLRPSFLSKPDVHSLMPILHLLEKTGAINKFSYAMMLLPTCPLREIKQINEIAIMAKKSESNVLSVVDIGQTIYHLKTIDESGNLVNIIDDAPVNFQHGDSEHVYALNAACYCRPMKDLIRYKTFHSSASIAYPMDEITGMDIDTLEQFKIAETIFNIREL
jgi:CMP-N,N'-diacetyllegionaminic acid synthase